MSTKIGLVPTNTYFLYRRQAGGRKVAKGRKQAGSRKEGRLQESGCSRKEGSSRKEAGTRKEGSRKEAGSRQAVPSSLTKHQEKAPKWPFRSLYLSVEMCPGTRKLPVDPIREYYHPAKFGPQQASLARVMRLMLQVWSSSGPAPTSASVRGGLSGMSPRE